MLPQFIYMLSLPTELHLEIISKLDLGSTYNLLRTNKHFASPLFRTDFDKLVITALQDDPATAIHTAIKHQNANLVFCYLQFASDRKELANLTHECWKQPTEGWDRLLTVDDVRMGVKTLKRSIKEPLSNALSRRLKFKNHTPDSLRIIYLLLKAGAEDHNPSTHKYARKYVFSLEQQPNPPLAAILAGDLDDDDDDEAGVVMMEEKLVDAGTGHWHNSLDFAITNGHGDKELIMLLLKNGEVALTQWNASEKLARIILRDDGIVGCGGHGQSKAARWYRAVRAERSRLLFHMHKSIQAKLRNQRLHNETLALYRDGSGAMGSYLFDCEMALKLANLHRYRIGPLAPE